MSVYGDPTPCPAPRMSAHDKVGAWLDANAPTEEVTTAGIPSFRTSNRMIDAKPRRPGRPAARKNAQFEILDEENDTFAFHTAPRASTSAPPPIHGPPPQAPESLARVAPRRSSMFLQPPQKLPLDVSRSSKNDVIPQKRRISIIAEDAADQTVALPDNITTNLTLSHIPEHKSTIRREPRRRTVYIPSDDTTVMTIHPGHAGTMAQPRRPRRSDIFLDLAEVPEDNVETVPRPVRRAPRPSLAGAPRRAPLGLGARQSLAPNAQLGDLAGSGTGKENIPPGLPVEAKRLGKRASFIIPSIAEKQDHESTLFPSAADHHRSQAPREDQTSNMAPLLEEIPSTSASKGMVARRESMAGTSLQSQNSNLASSRRRSIAPALLAQTRRQSMLPKLPETLAAPTLAVKSKKDIPRYSVIAEDLATPQLYEDNWISHQEVAMTQLMNSLFDRVGHGTNKVTIGDKGLRMQLLDIHQDPANALLHKRLQASLQFGALCIPSDMLTQVMRIKADLGQRQRFLDLWMKTYTRSALQMAAEVVLAREINSSPRSSDCSGSDSTGPKLRTSSKALSAFLRTFLIENADVAIGRQSMLSSALHNFAEKDSPSMAPTWAWRRTVLRSLMLILLLDRAKNAGVFRGCLFQFSSPCKSSQSVVQALAKILLPSIGDIQRVLGHLNYSVTHVQYPLQEYKYPIDNLATDLRDGIRLTRLVETLLYPPSSLAERKADEDITISLPAGEVLTCTLDASDQPQHPQSQSWVLSQHLKYPCLGRPQKVYNAQIALSALQGIKEVGPLITGIKAEDLVDGHREKTVGLLWALVSRWGMEALLDFQLVEHEIVRLEKEFSLLSPYERNKRGALASKHGSTSVDAESPYMQGPEKHKRLLLLWAQSVGRLHGARIDNLSTSFADGKAFEAILAEYGHALKSNSVPGRSSEGSSRPLAQQLRTLGCSQAFIALFPMASMAGSSTDRINSMGIATSKTTVPLLAFLASRLLPAAAPHIAASTIQRAWRRAAARHALRRRVVCARLARDCAMVVQCRERIEWAARVIQRKWKEVCWK